jgi:hypothetical protein
MKQILPFLAAMLFCGALKSQTNVLDFETAGTSTTYQYFGSSLDGTLNNIVDNPDASGINTSAKVADHVKTSGAETWAGAFPNPGLTVPINMTANNRICVKVWLPSAGNVGIKLEGNAAAGNWLNTVDVTEAQTWVEVCVDPSNPSIEPPNQVVAGNTFTGITLFFNFGVSPSSNITYYWDDLVLKSISGTDDVLAEQQLFTVAPTLAGDFTTLTFNDNSLEEKLVRVFNASGMLIEGTKVSGNTHEVQTGGLAAGLYFVTVQAGERKATKKFVKR